MSDHTPGPWLLDMADGAGWICTEGGRAGFEPVAHLSDVSDADAHLIAAAPELLAALRESVAVGDVREDYDVWHARMERARAAIAKAEGVPAKRAPAQRVPFGTIEAQRDELLAEAHNLELLAFVREYQRARNFTGYSAEKWLECDRRARALLGSK